MATEYPAFKAAAAHVAPVFLDAEKTVAKACSLIAEAARQGAALIAFPETYIPAFPLWSAAMTLHRLPLPYPTDACRPLCTASRKTPTTPW